MKYLRLVILLFTIPALLVTALDAQSLKKQKPNLTKTNISTTEFQPVKYSRKKYALLQKTIGDISEYYITPAENSVDPANAGKKEKLFSIHNDDKVKFIQFSKSGNQVIYRKEKNGKKVWRIHDIKTQKTRTIESDEGPINTASFYNLDNFLYIVSPKKDRNKAYLIKDNGDPLYIGSGISVMWAPNGKYFLILSPLEKSLSLREKLKFGIITKEEYKEKIKKQGGPQREIFRRYMIYNAVGEKLLILEDFDLVDWIQWSPDSKKIVLKERKDKGFKIIYLNSLSENNVEIMKVYHFPGFPNQTRKISYHCQNPMWSPDASKILFTTEVEDGENVLYNNAYIFEDGSSQYYPIIESSDKFISTADWLSDKSILFHTYNINTRKIETYELSIE